MPFGRIRRTFRRGGRGRRLLSGIIGGAIEQVPGANLIQGAIRGIRNRPVTPVAVRPPALPPAPTIPGVNMGQFNPTQALASIGRSLLGTSGNINVGGGNPNVQPLHTIQSTARTTTPMNGNGNDALVTALLNSRGRGRRRSELFDALLLSDPDLLASISSPPIQYVGPNGGILYRSSPGNVIIRRRRAGQEIIVQMNRELAIRLGLYRRSKRPGLSARDTEAIRRAKRAKKRVKKLAEDVDYHVYNEARARRSRTTRTSTKTQC